MLAHALLYDHQLDDYEEWREWDTQRQTREHLQWSADIGALYDNLWMHECGRRWMKTGLFLVPVVEEMLRRPGARGMIATPMQKNIGRIIVPLANQIFRDLPEGYRPVYRPTLGADHECLYIEATNSITTLVGLDRHPDASRGQWLDFFMCTEAAYVKGLYELMTSVINHQFRYRPWAWSVFESSTAKVPDCDFNREFREDCKLRGAYRLRTILDNPMLTDEEIAREERMSGGKHSAACRRELYCEEIRDEDTAIIPEFDENVHVVDPADWPMPRYAIAYTGLDPGVTDPCGLVWIYFDWSKQVTVVCASWQRSNASTGEVAEMVRETERELWGTQHRLSGRERVRELTIADADAQPTGHVWDAPSGAITYWDVTTSSLRANPGGRVSDVANRFVLDLNADYGMSVRKALKSPGSAEADTEYLRTMFRERTEAGLPRIVVLRNGKTANIIEQLRSGTWNSDENNHRTDWARSKILGHCDCLAALKYVVRDIQPNRNPNRPALVDVHVSDVHIPDTVRKTLQAPPKIDTYGGRKTRRGFR